MGRFPVMKKNNGYELTKADFKQINKRSLFGFQMGWNYERMQGSGIHLRAVRH